MKEEQQLPVYKKVWLNKEYGSIISDYEYQLLTWEQKKGFELYNPPVSTTSSNTSTPPSSLDRSVSQPGKSWEIFSDPSYYDMIAVREVGDTDFNSPRLFHFSNHEDAIKFRDLIEKSNYAESKLSQKEEPERDFDIDVLLSWISHRRDFDFLTTEMNQYVKDHKFEKAADSRDHRDAKSKILSDLEVTVKELFEKYSFYAGEPNSQPPTPNEQAIEVLNRHIQERDKLIEAQDEYIKFLGKEIGDNAIYMHIHGMDASEETVQKGIDFRAKIEEYKKSKL